MDDLKSVIRGLEICSAGDANSNRRAYTDCPFYPAGYTGCSAKRLLSAALEIMKAQEPRVLTLEEVKRNAGETVWVERWGERGAHGLPSPRTSRGKGEPWPC